LDELGRGAPPRSSAPLEPDDDAYEAGKRRGQRERAAEARDIFEGFRKVGAG